MLKEIVADSNLVAYCGLYCGACKRYLSGGCPGCHENTKAAWCKVRACCLEHNYATCADCQIKGDVSECKEFKSFMAKVFGFIFQSNRVACIRLIKKEGLDAHAAQMTQNRTMSIKR